ncbi:hypothetical protein ACLB1S_01000 [Escherichia coli]
MDIRIPYATDPAGNRLQPGAAPDSTLSMWPDDRYHRDARSARYDHHGRLTEKTDLIPEGLSRMMSAPTGTITTVSTAGALHADTICRAAGRKPLSLRPAGPQGGKTGVAT